MNMKAVRNIVFLLAGAGSVSTLAQDAQIRVVAMPWQSGDVKLRFQNLEEHGVFCSRIVVNLSMEVQEFEFVLPLIFRNEYIAGSNFTPLRERTQEAKDWAMGELGSSAYKVRSIQLDTAGTSCRRQICPPDFIPIPGDPTPNLGGINNPSGVAPFCLAKYEMKHPFDPTGCASERCADTDSAVPVSRPEHKPWTNINRDEAREACGRMNNGSNPGFQFSLVSNGQWQTVARNIERTAGNWSGGTVGSEGVIPKGHTDEEPSASLAASHDGDGYAGTGNHAGGGWEQKRTHVLSNGEVLWDLGGNASEWINDDFASLGVDMNNYASQELIDLSPHNRALFGPVGNYGIINNFGYFATYLDIDDAVNRGGGWRTGGLGIFYTNIAIDPTFTYDDYGFRCAAYPAR